ncbi:hypothetical protein [Hyphomicrobium sp. DY-1]|uniref:hypothetical protein n=1 Tax=Hyphomicrobium sp. DY-1 TaxID=3075650 RepID=UPI0039C349CD
MTLLPRNPSSGQTPVATPSAPQPASVTSAHQRLIAAQRALFAHDQDVLSGKVQPDFDRRFALNLERRSAQLRYDLEVDPI